MQSSFRRWVRQTAVSIALIALGVSLVGCAATRGGDSAGNGPSDPVATGASDASSAAELLRLEAVRIRIENRSGAAIESVVVKFPEETVAYGDVPSEDRTDYRTVEQAYRYAYVEAVVDGKREVLRPDDYVGESLLSPGDYTYVLDVDRTAPDGFGLRLDFRQD